MPPQPLYDPAKIEPAYQLRYSWTGWTSRGAKLPEPPPSFDELNKQWEKDGLRALEQRTFDESIQILFSVTPAVSPVHLAARAKGRLDHAFRSAGKPMTWSRKLAVRAVGNNTRDDVEQYISRQVEKEGFGDPRHSEWLSQYTIEDASIDLSSPTESGSGRYWNNLHVVLVVDGRFRFCDSAPLQTIRDGCLRIAKAKGHAISRLSVMPEHLHVAMRAPIDKSPNDVVHAYQNNLAFYLNHGRVWRDTFYVGTFGEYGMSAVRRAVAAENAVE